jgi:hypothetical protein
VRSVTTIVEGAPGRWEEIHHYIMIGDIVSIICKEDHMNNSWEMCFSLALEEAWYFEHLSRGAARTKDSGEKPTYRLGL